MNNYYTQDQNTRQYQILVYGFVVLAEILTKFTCVVKPVWYSSSRSRTAVTGDPIQSLAECTFSLDHTIALFAVFETGDRG